jgi:hypothetical protein
MYIHTHILGLDYRTYRQQIWVSNQVPELQVEEEFLTPL